MRGSHLQRLARFLLPLCCLFSRPTASSLRKSKPVVNDDLLRRDIRLLDGKLDAVIVEQAGPEASTLVADIRRLARDRRLGMHEAEPLLADKIAGLDVAQARIVARALSIFFDLANIAEDRQRVRVLRDRERLRHPQPLGESLAAAIQELAAGGMPAPEMQRALDSLAIELVFTAHPSEAKRRSIRAKLRRMRQSLQALDRDDLLARERTELESDLQTELVILSETEFLKPARPTVLDEVDRGLSLMPRLWEAVPQVHESLRRGLAAAYPGESFEIPAFLTFGSWMGGDRDGNPFVTADITETTLLRLRATAIQAHLAWCKQLYDMLTVSLDEARGSQPLEDRLQAAVVEWPELAAVLEKVLPHEAYRRWLRIIEFRLRASQTTSLDEPAAAAAYPSATVFAADVATLIECLDRDHGLSADSPVRRWLDLVRTFGLHMTRLDVRQDARAYEEIMADIFSAARIAGAETLRSGDEAACAELLTATLGTVGTIPLETLQPLSRDTLQLFALLQQVSARFGPDCLGGAIVSLTRSPADVLCVLWLWRWAQKQAADQGQPVATHDIAIMPLFEKIHDLQHGHETLGDILDTPAYREHLASRGNRQLVMVGYSDSTKDGGYLAACWGLQAAQSRLHAAAAARGVALTFFHGRGGSLGRPRHPVATGRNARRIAAAHRAGRGAGRAIRRHRNRLPPPRAGVVGHAHGHLQQKPRPRSCLDRPHRADGRPVACRLPRTRRRAGLHRLLLPDDTDRRHRKPADRLAPGPPPRPAHARRPAGDPLGVCLDAKPLHDPGLVRPRHRTGRREI